MLAYRTTPGASDAAGSLVVKTRTDPPRSRTLSTSRVNVRATPFTCGA
jgi:hypothetical protein